MKTVGVLALQGDFQEHFDILAKLGAAAMPVKLPEDLDQIDRLIIPGGESTTIGKLLVTYKLLNPLRERIKKGMPVWGTCAGAILLAKRVADGAKGQSRLAAMDIMARRNAFGRQLQSFETSIEAPKVSKRTVPVFFIRAPVLESPGRNVRVLARHEGKIVAVQQDHMLATCFHPELTQSLAFHNYFLSI